MFNIAVADDTNDLKKSIFDISNYEAKFSQQVKNATGQVLQDGEGSIKLLRPNYFRMDIETPSEALILANGKEIYNYDEMLEQVTVYSQGSQMVNSPFLLLISQDNELWNKYTVTRKDNSKHQKTYEIVSNNQEGLIKSFVVTLNRHNLLQEIVITENDERQNIYKFSDIKTNKLSSDDFKYAIPERISIDDQRQK